MYFLSRKEQEQFQKKYPAVFLVSKVGSVLMLIVFVLLILLGILRKFLSTERMYLAFGIGFIIIGLILLLNVIIIVPRSRKYWEQMCHIMEESRTNKNVKKLLSWEFRLFGDSQLMHWINIVFQVVFGLVLIALGVFAILLFV